MAIPLRPLDLAAQQYPDFVKLSGEDTSELLQTDFGLKLKISDKTDGSGVVTIVNDRPLQSPSTEGLKITGDPGRYGYRLIPDYEMSSLFYDINWPHNPFDEFVVDWPEIEERYPALLPFHTEWMRGYDESLTKREFDEWVSSDMASRVAFDVGGILIACWLVLQNDVEYVRYHYPTKHYVIIKNNVEEKLREFLIEVNDLLKSGKYGGEETEL